MEDTNKLHELLRKYCCSSALVAMGLYHKGEENEQLVKTVSALCGGLQSGLVCGALTGGACMIRLVADSPKEDSELIRELTDWFKSTYGEAYGGTDCKEILQNDPTARQMRCPGIVEATYVYCMELLEDYGYL